jgi:uncharacterized membrane protein
MVRLIRRGPRRLPLTWGLLGALAAAQIAYGRGRAPRPPAETRAVVALMLVASVVEGVQARGVRRGGLPLAAAGALGFAAELVGVATGFPFGRYSYSDRLGRRVCGVPLLAAAGWAMMTGPAWIAAGWIRPRGWLRVPLAAGALTAWDVFLDPRMVRERYWRWPDGGRYENVPASNFLGWLATGLAVFAAMRCLDQRAPVAADDGALALYTLTWVGETFANAALWRRPRVAVAGGLAMGAFAVPALWRRVR